MTENANATDTDISKMSFEDALTELEGIIDQLESGNVQLEQSIAIYERGDKLCKHCDSLLKTAESKIQKLKISADGTPTGTELFETESEAG